jgi:hypothetical protein
MLALDPLPVRTGVLVVIDLPRVLGRVRVKAATLAIVGLLDNDETTRRRKPPARRPRRAREATDRRCCQQYVILRRRDAPSPFAPWELLVRQRFVVEAGVPSRSRLGGLGQWATTYFARTLVGARGIRHSPWWSSRCGGLTGGHHILRCCAACLGRFDRARSRDMYHVPDPPSQLPNSADESANSSRPSSSVS